MKISIFDRFFGRSVVGDDQEDCGCPFGVKEHFQQKKIETSVFEQFQDIVIDRLKQLGPQGCWRGQSRVAKRSDADDRLQSALFPRLKGGYYEKN